MRKFFTLLIVAISFISCSSDTDDKVRNSGFVEKMELDSNSRRFCFPYPCNAELVADSNEHNKLTN